MDNIIESFFSDQQEYINFLVSKKQIIIASDKGTYFAELKKEEGYYLYTLTCNLKSRKFVGDYVKPFRASLENIEIFNNGCKILAERLITYIETGDINLVPSFPPAFGVLTYYK